MKMACLISSVSRKAGGLHESVRRLAQSMRATGEVEVHVLGLKDEFTREDIESWAPLPTQAFPVRGPWQFGYAPRLRPAMIELDPDIVQIHGIWMYPTVAAASWHRQTRKPFIVNPHGMLDPWAVRNSRWKKKLAGWVYENPSLRRAACIRALCRSEARSIRAYGLRNPICVIPNGIDLPKQPTQIPPPWAEKVGPHKNLLLYLGRLHPKKGLPHLLRAWKASRQNPAAAAWDLAIAGWSQGGHEQHLKDLARNLAIDSSVHFLGPLFGDAKAAAYQHASGFILPSFSEGLPMVVLEAWAHAVPVLMTPECNLPEGFTAGAACRTGTEPGPIAASLERFFGLSAGERKEMGERGYELAARNFAWPRIAGDLVAVNRWVLGGGDKPACIITEMEVPGED